MGQENENKGGFSRTRPADAKPKDLELARIAGEEFLVGLPGTPTYLKDSLFMKEWLCDGCGTDRIPCAQGECPICNSPRPEKWRDNEQEGGKLGEHRQRARRNR